MVEAMNKILKDSKVTVSAVSLIVSTDMPAEITDPNVLFMQVKDFFDKGPATCKGWLCFTDEVAIVPEEFCFAAGASGIILSGELACGNESLHIRQSGNGWQIFVLTREDGGEMLMVTETYLSTRDGGKKLCYENYWKKEPNKEGLEVYRPFAARFAGFDPGGI